MELYKRIDTSSVPLPPELIKVLFSFLDEREIMIKYNHLILRVELQCGVCNNHSMYYNFCYHCKILRTSPFPKNHIKKKKHINKVYRDIIDHKPATVDNVFENIHDAINRQSLIDYHILNFTCDNYFPELE